MKEYFCEACGRKHRGQHSSHYCRKHQLELEKYGKVLDYNPRNKFDPNEFRFIGDDIVEFDTYTQPSMDIHKTYIIDSRDYPIVSKYHWHTNKAGYATSGYNSLLLHRLLLQPKPGQQVDHINLNILDNRRCNLRICDNSLNQMNKAPYNQLGIKGVQYHSHINKYSAYYRKEGKQYHSPCYNSKEEAAFARFILEQMFCNEPLTQFSKDLVCSLNLEIKASIISSLQHKFNKD